MTRRLSAFLVGVFAMLACSKPETHPVRVFAASSLRESCEEIGKLWDAQHRAAVPAIEGERLEFNFGASNVLAQQIVASHTADVFISADTAQLEVLRTAGLVVTVGRSGWLSNQLVVVVPASRNDIKIESAADLTRLEFAKLSLANPEAVPAGKYAKAWLESKGAWNGVEARVVPSLDVRAALAAVESQACDIGIVYSTDAAITDKVRVAFRVPLAEAPKIEYAIASLIGPAGEQSYMPPPPAVVEFFMGDEARKVFESRGFIVGKVD